MEWDMNRCTNIGVRYMSVGKRAHNDVKRFITFLKILQIIFLFVCVFHIQFIMFHYLSINVKNKFSVSAAKNNYN